MSLILQGWKDENGQEVNVGRMNLGVVTLNLPRIAMEAKGDQEKFWQILADRLAIMKDALVYRVDRCKEAIPANALSFTCMEPLANAFQEQMQLMSYSKIVVLLFH